MPDNMRRAFEGFCLLCCTMGEQIPLGFVMGFFVDLIVARWWEQFVAIPWPDELVMLLAAYTHGNSKRLRHQLKTFVRYINLSFCLATRGMSSRMRRRFPTKQQLLASTLITQEELKVLYESAPYNKPPFYPLPLFWAAELLTQMHEEGSIVGVQVIETITTELQKFRRGLEQLLIYNWINTPLAYTQVATVTVHSYFISSIFAWQFLDTNQNYANHSIDMYVPVFGMLRFLFYMGWLKVSSLRKHTLILN
ncbi:unnamed protein product [Schistocephalus solidus]|uniref:Bestrophin homolog n=1 Tax=Schistocephalus solidus TaxID=70667 RepID=A0A183S9J6_SCHSO|nr:unnamed protein product [Schistocephalus solidus]